MSAILDPLDRSVRRSTWTDSTSWSGGPFSISVSKASRWCLKIPKSKSGCWSTVLSSSDSVRGRRRSRTCMTSYSTVMKNGRRKIMIWRTMTIASSLNSSKIESISIRQATTSSKPSKDDSKLSSMRKWTKSHS